MHGSGNSRSGVAGVGPAHDGAGVRSTPWPPGKDSDASGGVLMVCISRSTARLRRGGRRLRATVCGVERRTRPVDLEFRAALARRWAGLPEVVRTPGQVLGRHGVGCEGTHGIFPRCNLACTPCYHSRDANQVRVDGPHTLAGVAAQMGLLRAVRGPRARAQLIGGEVSLLHPDDHAEALGIMRAHGREPMSFTHGDIDDDYLDALVLGPDGACWGIS